MRAHALIWLLLALLLTGRADSRGVSVMTGVGSSGGAALAPCGTGVISMAAGCTIVIMLGLVP